jgi:hypothetical protein
MHCYGVYFKGKFFENWLTCHKQNRGKSHLDQKMGSLHIGLLIGTFLWLTYYNKTSFTKPITFTIISLLIWTYWLLTFFGGQYQRRSFIFRTF